MRLRKTYYKRATFLLKHTTLFETKVDVFDINMNAVTPATKGKKVDRPTMMKSLDKVLRQWGEYGGKLIVNFAI